MINWLWFDWVTWGFSSSFLSIFIQIFQKLIKKTIWFLIVSRIWKILTSLFKSLLTHKVMQNIWNKIRNPVKLDRTRKVWYLLFSVFNCYWQNLSCRDTGHHLQGFLNCRKGWWWWWWGLEILMGQFEQQQWLLLKMLFLLGYNLKIYLMQGREGEEGNRLLVAGDFCRWGMDEQIIGWWGEDLVWYFLISRQIIYHVCHTRY